METDRPGLFGCAFSFTGEMGITTTFSVADEYISLARSVTAKALRIKDLFTNRTVRIANKGNPHFFTQIPLAKYPAVCYTIVKVFGERRTH